MPYVLRFILWAKKTCGAENCIGVCCQITNEWLEKRSNRCFCFCFTPWTVCVCVCMCVFVKIAYDISISVVSANNVLFYNVENATCFSTLNVNELHTLRWINTVRCFWIRLSDIYTRQRQPHSAITTIIANKTPFPHERSFFFFFFWFRHFGFCFVLLCYLCPCSCTNNTTETSALDDQF